jgi:thioredoxin-related protein
MMGKRMLSRRALLGGMTGLIVAPLVTRAAPVLGDDGLYHEPWFLESFLELADDLEGAAAKGKRFVIMWELKGCPYCRDTHLVNFADPEIAGFIRERSEVLQLNLIGAREVVDFDGETLAEKRLAEKYGVRFTPTFQFFPEPSALGRDKKPREREVLRTQGYLPPKDFLASFAFVAERAYDRQSLRHYLDDQARRAPTPAAGQLTNSSRP